MVCDNVGIQLSKAVGGLCVWESVLVYIKKTLFFFLTEHLILSFSFVHSNKTELKHHMVWNEASHDAEERHCDVVKGGHLTEALEVHW